MRRKRGDIFFGSGGFPASVPAKPADQASLIQWLISDPSVQNDNETVDKLDPQVVTNAEYVGNSCVQMNGTSSVIRTYKKYDGVSDINFSIWCNPDNFTALGYLISDRLGSTNRIALAVVNSTGQLRAQVQTASGYQEFNGSTNLTVGQWDFVQFTISASTGALEILLNGNSIATGTVNGTLVEGRDFTVGAQSPTGVAYFAGKLSQAYLENHFSYPLAETDGSYGIDNEWRTGDHLSVFQQIQMNPYPNDVLREVVHPDIYIFDTPWNGYTHWIAYTPYASSNNQVENPSIEASNDGIVWETPAGLTNPLVPSPGGASDFNSDPELIFDDKKLKMYYRESNLGVNESIKIMESSDGVNWSSPALVINSNLTNDVLLSPTVVNNGTEWVMITTNNTAGNWEYRTSSTPESGWSVAGTCTVLNAPSTLWHQKMRYINGEYVMYAQLGGSGGGSLYRITSNDYTSWDFNNAVNVNDSVYPILDSRNFYRSTFWPSDKGEELWLGNTTPWNFYYGVWGELGNNAYLENCTWTTSDELRPINIEDGFRANPQQTAPYTPPLLSEPTTAADGNPLTNQPSKVHNGAESLLRQTDAQMLGLAGDGSDTFWSDNGSVIKDISYADLLAHPSFQDNLLIKWVKVNGVCHVTELLQREFDYVYTEKNYNKDLRYIQKETADCGANPVPF